MFRSTRNMRNSISDRLVKVSDRSEHSYDTQNAKTLFFVKITPAVPGVGSSFGVMTWFSKNSSAKLRKDFCFGPFLKQSSGCLVYRKIDSGRLETLRKKLSVLYYFS